ncbi:hypothetical protein ACQ4PT_071817 [Festuca glaucescens]
METEQFGQMKNSQLRRVHSYLTATTPTSFLGKKVKKQAAVNYHGGNKINSRVVRVMAAKELDEGKQTDQDRWKGLYYDTSDDQQDITRGKGIVDSLFQAPMGDGTHEAVLSSYEYISHGLRKYDFDNTMDGLYIAPAFMDKLVVHLAKNFMTLPNIRSLSSSVSGEARDRASPSSASLSSPRWASPHHDERRRAGEWQRRRASQAHQAAVPSTGRPHARTASRLQGHLPHRQCPRRGRRQARRHLPGQSIDFFGALRARVYDDEVRKWVSEIGVENIPKRLVNSREGPPTFEQPKMTIEKLMEYGHMLVQEQDNVKRVQLADKYLSEAALGSANDDAMKNGHLLRQGPLE